MARAWGTVIADAQLERHSQEPQSLCDVLPKSKEWCASLSNPHRRLLLSFLQPTLAQLGLSMVRVRLLGYRRAGGRKRVSVRTH